MKKQYTAEPIPRDAQSEIDRLMQSADLFRYTSENSPVTLLEKEFADIMGMKYALAVSSCSAALHLSLEALNLGDGARILLPAFTFAAVPSSVVNARMIPVLIEVGDNYRIDLEDFESKLDLSIDAVMISHMRGHTSDMDTIMSLCDARGIPVIEDAAHSLGTLWNNQLIGTIGKVGCFSFQSYKMLNAGEGGMLITNNAELAARAIIMSGAYEYNWKKHNNDIELTQALQKWQNQLPLYNLRLQNLSAAVIRPQLPLLSERVANGLKNHDYVAEKLNQLPWISVPDPLPSETRAPDSIQFNLISFAEDEVVEFQNVLNQAGLQIQIFGLSIDNARSFWNWKFIAGDKMHLPKTKQMLMRACDVRLPTWLSTDELNAIVDKITSAVNQIKS